MKSQDVEILLAIFAFLNDPSQTVATARIAPEISARASFSHLAHTVPDLISKWVHFRRSYCRTREDCFCREEVQETSPNILRRPTRVAFLPMSDVSGIWAIVRFAGFVPQIMGNRNRDGFIIIIIIMQV